VCRDDVDTRGRNPEERSTLPHDAVFIGTRNPSRERQCITDRFIFNLIRDDALAEKLESAFKIVTMIARVAIGPPDERDQAGFSITLRRVIKRLVRSSSSSPCSWKKFLKDSSKRK
jgi:hypothetical protein